MDAVRLKALLEAYGGDPARWPAVERLAAETFAAENASAFAPLFEEARTLDAALREVQTLDAAPCDLLAARVLRRAPAPVSLGHRALAALAACAALGVLVGYGGALLAPPSDFGFDVADMFGGPGEGG